MHQLSVTMIDGSTRTFSGRSGELWRLRVKLLRARQVDPRETVTEQLSTGKIAVPAGEVWRVGRIVDAG